MNGTKQQRLEAAGWKIGTTAEFLGLSDEESALVEIKLSLSRKLRERRQQRMTQAELAAVVGTHQTVISRIENVNYSGWGIGTLKKVARAFGVRLKVSFEEYGTLPEEVVDFGRGSLQRAARDSDPGLLHDIPPNERELEKLQRLASIDDRETSFRIAADTQSAGSALRAGCSTTSQTSAQEASHRGAFIGTLDQGLYYGTRQSFTR